MTSFVFRVRNVPAALYKALGGFATNGVNMSKIESYMVEGEFAATQFLCDVDGHPDDPALARALALDPEILFLDEPTSGLDPIGAAEFDTLIRTLQKTLGLTVYMVTHDLDSLYSICDRIAALAGGKIVAAGTLQEILQVSHPWVQSYFHGARARARGGSS